MTMPAARAGGGGLSSAVEGLLGQAGPESGSTGGTGKGGDSGKGIATLTEGGSDPLGTMLSGGASWLIEHIGFLREPFNYLTGDPDAITGHGDNLRAVAKALDGMAQQRQQGLSGVGASWQGASAQAYQRCGQVQASAITVAAKAAADLSTRVLRAGDVIGDARSQVLSMVSDLVAALIPRAMLAMAGAVESLGGTVSVFIADAIVAALAVAGKAATIIQKVLEVLQELRSGVQRLGGLIDRVSGQLGNDRSDHSVTGAAAAAAKDGGGEAPFKLSYREGKIGIGVAGLGGVETKKGGGGLHYRIGPEDAPFVEGDVEPRARTTPRTRARPHHR